MKRFGSPSRRVFTVALLLSILIGWCAEAISAQLSLTWFANSTNELGFSVERSTGTTSVFSEITTTAPGATSYTDSSIVVGTTYCYRIRAFNAMGYSAYTDLACGISAQLFGLSVVKLGLGSGTVTSAPVGIDCGTSCSGNYASGTTVALTAVPATGSTFTGWSGGGCTGTGTCTVTLTAITAVSATFAPASFTLAVNTSGTGSGTVTSTPAGISCGASCVASYASGTAVTLTAAPAAGSTFTGWNGGGCSGIGNCIVTLTAATTVTATFAQTISDITPPTAPPGLTAAPVSNSQIDLSWGPSTDATGVTGYRVERCQGVGCASFGQVAAPTGTRFSDTGLLAGTTYNYRVQATDGAGNVSAYSNVAAAVTLTSPPPTDWVAAYAFDETSGTTASDSSGNGNTGLLTNGALFGPGKHGNAVSLDGMNDYVDLGIPTALQITGSLTLSAWINSRSFPADDAGVISQRGTTPSGIVGYQLDTTIDTGPRTIGFKLTNSDGGNMIRYGTTPMLANQWYHIAGVYDAAARTMTVYLNGQLDNGALVGTITTSQQNSGLNTTIGRRSGTAGYEFAGLIDDVRIYARALSQADIQIDMDVPVGSTAPDKTPPTNPTGLAATAVSAVQIALGWGASMDDVGVTVYSVERCEGAGCASFVQIATPKGTTFSDTSLPAATSYSYRVRAADAAGNLSGYSNIASATLPFFTLTVSKAGTGSGTVTSTPTGVACGATCSWSYLSGTTVTLAATLGTGSTFTGWSGSCTGTGTCSVALTSAATVSATFALQPLTLIVTKAGTGGGTVTSTPTGVSCGATCSWNYPSGTTVALAATPDTGSTFTGWSGGCNSGAGSCSVNLTASTSVTATFASGPLPGSTPTTTSINAPTVTYNSKAVVTVTVSAATGTPTGVVSLAVDNGAPLTATLSNGKAQFTLTGPSVGDHTLQASYAVQGVFGASSATATLHVNGSTVLFSSATYSVGSGSPAVTITVLRSGATNSKVTVGYATSDGTAHAGVDYTATSGTLTFNAGVTTKTFSVRILANSLTAPKTVNLTLSNPSSGNALGTPSVALLTLLPSSSGKAGLVAAYSFNEGAGATLTDVSGNNNTGTIGGATWTTQGRFGKALVFNGASALVTVNDAASLRLTSGMTLEAWVNPSTVTGTWRDVIYKGNDDYYLEATSPNGGRPAAGGTFVAAIYGASPLPLNTWSHLAVTYDRMTLRLYVNGVQVASRAQTTAIATSANPLQIGGDKIFGQYFQGMIDEVRIYNRALSGTEIQNDMNTPL